MVWRVAYVLERGRFSIVCQLVLVSVRIRWYDSAMSRLAAIAFMALAIAGPAFAQQPPPPAPVVNVQALGPRVGARMPDFTLLDQSGTPRTLRSLMGPKGLMLVLFRSADW